MNAFRKAGLQFAATLVVWTLVTPAHAARDWTGVWVLADTFMDKQDGSSLATPGRLNPAAGPPGEPRLQLKGEYLARDQERRKSLAANEAAGRYIDQAGADCKPLGMPRFWIGPYAFEILYNPRQMNVFQEAWEQTRRIYLDDRKHPTLNDADPLYQGHSVGRWEGDVLVVETTHISLESKFGNGADHSDALRIVERFTEVAPGLIEIAMTIDDQQALAEPWSATYRLRRKTGMEIADYVCSENNRNPANEAGESATILKGP